MIATKQYLKVTFVLIILITTGFFPILSAEQPVKNMETFARLYGYVKYFYPGDEAAATDKEKPYISAATDGWLMFRALSELQKAPGDSDVSVKIERETGENLEVAMKPVPKPTFYNMYQNRGQIKSKKMKEGIYYMALDSITMEEIDALMPELEKARGIISDLRGYPYSNDVTWTGMRVVKHDGSRHHGVGIIPHVRVERTIKGVRAGRDEFIEKAVEIIEK